jgi:hypothetical protein
MRHRICLAILVMGLLISETARAQSSDVTFRVPLNLTQLSPDITHVEVRCSITSPAIPGQGGHASGSSQLPVVAGQVSATATIVVRIPLLNNPAGQTATYRCSLHGRINENGFVWMEFSNSNPRPAFRLSPVPSPIVGSFPWVQVDANAPPPPASTTSPGGQP